MQVHVHGCGRDGSRVERRHPATGALPRRFDSAHHVGPQAGSERHLANPVDGKLELEDHEGGPSAVFVTGAWGATLPGLSVVEGGTIPYKPEALAKRDENRKNALPGKPGRNLNADPELNCFLPGVPRATYLPHPFQIFQSPNRMWMVYQFSYARREIFMNGKSESPIDSWMGWSNARWDGDTLVIDVTGVQRPDMVRSGRQLPYRRPSRRGALPHDRSGPHHV